MPTEDAGLPRCEASQPAKFGACVRFEDVGPSSDDPPQSFTGVVEAIERPEMLCGAGLGDAPRNNEDEQGYALTVREGDVVATIGVYLPWRTPFVEVGATVRIEYSTSSSIEAGPSGALTIRDENGDLLLWFLDASHGFSQHGLPAELEMRDGDALCMSRDPSCPDIRRGVIAQSRGSGDVPIEPGGMADVGDYVVLLGSNTAGMCDFSTNPYYQSITSAVVRGSQETLAERD